jgi:S-adenosylmethionine synthetase
MSETLVQLQALLAKQGALSENDITKVVAQHGPLSEVERSVLEAERYEKERSKNQAISLEQYLAASKVLDSAAEDSDEYKKALALVEAYENGN